jgi:paraquat-inducible protein A
MVEVFIIGVIVSLVKIAAMATVVVGLAFWAYAAFTLCFTVTIGSLDRYQCWEHLEALGEHR